MADPLWGARRGRRADLRGPRGPARELRRGHRRPGHGRAWRRGHPVRDATRRVGASDRRGTAPSRDLQQLQGARGRRAGRRLRRGLRAGRAARAGRRRAAGADRGRGVPGACRRRADAKRQLDGPGAAKLRSRGTLHRDRRLVRLARHLWRHRDLGGMGPEARLRRRLHRQGHGHRRARSRGRYRQPHPRRARRCRSRGARVQLHGADRAGPAGGLQREDARPLRLQARAFAGQSRGGLGAARPGIDRVRLLRPERALSRRGRGALHAGDDARHRVERLERRRRRFCWPPSSTERA